ncbi:MAG: tail fiber domain-containing protein [Bryobacteraceae bacterium]
MRFSRRMLLPVLTVIAFVGFWSSPGMAQEAAPNVSGTGSAGRIAIWKNTTTLGNSQIVQSSGNVGIGTTTPAATLEVNGNAQVDGKILASGSVPVMQFPAGSFPTGSNNFSAGLGALAPGTTGTQNTAIGDETLENNTTGINNTAVGSSALQTNTTGSSNEAIGVDALLFNTTGGGNVAIGNSALVFNTTGTTNTAVGNVALKQNTTGNNNTVEGNAALYYNTTGSSNIAIGYTAGINIATTSNNIEIGNNGSVTDSGTIRIGTPFVAGCTTCQTSAFVAGIYGSSTGLANVGVVVDANGNLGTVSSSRRYKEDIQDMGDASDGLMQLRPVTFRYKKTFDDGSKPVQYGLIAEEVADVYPDLVARSADGQVESVRYQLLDPMLLNELQKEHTTITAQQERIRSLEERLAKVEAALSGTTVTAAAR